MVKIKNILIGIVIAVLLLLGGWAGYKIYPVRHPCPVITSDTVYVYDTIWHTIHDTLPWYIIKHDSIVYRDTVFQNIDTIEAVRNYYAIHYYTRFWQDTLIAVTKHDAITKNDFISSELTYKLLKPVTTINNNIINTIYSRYITVGADFPFKSIKHLNMNLEVKYISPKWNVGIGYDAELNCPTVSLGATVLKLK
jgi:hypothetical protein